MKAIIEFALKNRLLVLALTALLIGWGVWSALRLPIDAVPDVTNVQVQINANAPALSPLEVERQITLPVELAMFGLPDLEEVRSLSKFGLSQVTVIFKEGTDIYFARQQVQERLQEARGEIPEGVGTPEMGPISSGLGEIFQYSIESRTVDATELRTLQDWVVAPQLRGVSGVAEVNSFGGYAKQYQVLVRPEALVQYGLTLQQVLDAVAANNVNAGGGYITRGAEQLVVRGVGQVQDLDQIRAVVVISQGGTPVRVGDVAEVVIGHTIRQGAVTKDGRGEVVTGIVMMRMGENSRTVVDAVKERFAAAQRSLPRGVTLRAFYDRTELVERTIGTVEKNLFEGAILVVAVLFLLLGNFRAALVVALAIPLSMLFAFGMMVKAGIAGSLMSLGAIDFGLVVDGSVVMVENSMRHLAEREKKPFLRTVLDSCAEVSRPILFGVGIIIVVYLPILSLQGVEGKLFKPMAMTVVFALIGSLVLTFLLTPVLISLMLRGKLQEKDVWLMRHAKRIYRPALEWTLGHTRKVLVAAGVLVAAAVATFPFLGSEFIPRLDEGSLAIQVLRLPSISLEESIRQSTLMERRLMAAFPDEIEDIVGKTGRAEIATDPMGVNISDVLVMLKPGHQWKRAESKAELEELMGEVLEHVPGMVFSFSQPIELRVNELVAGVRSDLAVKIYGDDLATLKAKADETVAAVSRLEGATGFKAQQLTGLPQLQVTVLPEQLARYGINSADVMRTVEAIGGVEATTVLEGQRRFTLAVRFPEEARRNPEAIANLLVSAPGGERVPVGQLASIEEVQGPADISHENGSRLVIIEGNVRGRDMGSFVRDVEALFTSGRIALPTGYRVDFGGQFENLERGTRRLMLVVPLSLLLIFLLLFTTFNSLRQAALVFTGIPLATVGGVFALLLRGMPFSISAGVGFIALFGIAVLNGVVMVSYINELRQQGRDLDTAVREGGMTRLRPVLMTALVASLGFIPMAVSSSAGAEVQRPLATVVIGGLVTSTLLTLLVLPLLYRIFERKAVEKGDHPLPAAPAETLESPARGEAAAGGARLSGAPLLGPVGGALGRPRRVRRAGRGRGKWAVTTRRRTPATVLCLAALSACVPAPAPRSQVVPLHEVPFGYEAGHVVLPVRVNGSTPLRFILDTGFPVSAIDLRAARSAGLRLGPGPELSGVGLASFPGMRARGVRLDLQGVPSVRLDLAAFPMDALATQGGGRVDGILGMDVIGGWAVEIDYAARTLRLHAPGSYSCPNGCAVVPWVREGGEWFVTAQVLADGQPPVAGRFRLDTGSGGALALTRPFAEAHGLLAATPGTVEGTAFGIGGTSRRRVGRVAALSIGPFRVERPVTAFAQDSAGELARADFAGVIGADVLRRFRLVLDASRRRVLFMEYRPDPPPPGAGADAGRERVPR